MFKILKFSKEDFNFKLLAKQSIVSLGWGSAAPTKAALLAPKN
jgi:hypothetical protein